MLKQYKDLNLKELREKVGLDFAHYTYKRGMCSCCHGPADLPSIYWKNGTIRTDPNYEYILFQNADNGSGHVTANTWITGNVFISWRFPIEKMKVVCEELQRQLGDSYKVIPPENHFYSIEIHSNPDENRIVYQHIRK